MIGKYCGNNIPNNQISSTNNILLHFESDGSSTRAGFQLEYQGFDLFPGKQRIIAKFAR